MFKKRMRLLQYNSYVHTISITHTLNHADDSAFNDFLILFVEHIAGDSDPFEVHDPWWGINGLKLRLRFGVGVGGCGRWLR